MPEPFLVPRTCAFCVFHDGTLGPMSMHIASIFGGMGMIPAGPALGLTFICDPLRAQIFFRIVVSDLTNVGSQYNLTHPCRFFWNLLLEGILESSYLFETKLSPKA